MTPDYVLRRIARAALWSAFRALRHGQLDEARYQLGAWLEFTRERLSR